ncbi:MAG: cation:proton antiporter [Candidatus Bathyarchaeota archaeon]|nr:cation:proton antiporter [Candidatus Bathyarchaeota archaeon]
MAEDAILLLVVPLVAASVCGILARRLGFSAIAGYILGGVIVGPVFHLVDTESTLLTFLSELGIILISFEIGLVVKLDFLSRGGLKSGGIVAVEIVIVSLLTMFFGTVLNFSWGETLVLVFMAMNTSTAITFKMLEERGVKDPGTKGIILGVGAFEDIIAIVGLSVFPVLAAAGRPSATNIIQLLAGILLSVIFMVYIGLRILSRPLKWAAGKESEIFLALSLAVVLTYAYVGVLTGLSTAFGAFIAGLVVSNIGVQEAVEEKMKSLRDLSSLIFFSSIGASLPVVKDPALITIAILVSLFVVFVKFVGFSLSSWVMGIRLEQAFRLGLYMLAISEFGVILARNAVDSGFGSEELYLISVIALAGSAVMSSGLIMFEKTLPDRLASIFPKKLRERLEGTFRVVAEAFGKEAVVFEEIRSAFWELMRRVAIILLVVGVGNVAITYVTPIFFPLVIRGYVDIAVASFTIIIVAIVSLRMRGVYRKLIHGVASRVGKLHKTVNGRMESFLYFTTLALVATTILLVSFPLIARTFGGILGELGSGLVIIVVILIFFILARRAALRATRQLEETFELS